MDKTRDPELYSKHGTETTGLPGVLYLSGQGDDEDLTPRVEWYPQGEDGKWAWMMIADNELLVLKQEGDFDQGEHEQLYEFIRLNYELLVYNWFRATWEPSAARLSKIAPVN